VESALGTLEASGSEAVMAQTALQRGLQRLDALFVVQTSGNDSDGVRETVALDAAGTGTSYHDWPLELAEGECIAAWAFAGADGPDVDLEIHNPAGWVEMQDAGTDSMPVLPQFCAQSTGVHTVRLVAASGAGDAAIAVRRWPADALLADTALNEAFAEFGAPGAIIRTWPLQRNRLQELYVHESPAVLSAPGCYWAVAWTPEEGDDVDLEWTDAIGEPVLRDISTDRRPVAGPLCIDSPLMARLRVKMYAGSGDVWWRIVHTEARPSED
jgi:hypothetical protein